MGNHIEYDTFLQMDSHGFYKLDIPERLNMARLSVDYWADHGRAHDVAMYYKDEQITYGELRDLTNSFGAAFYKLGVSKGDRFVIRTPNLPEYEVAFFGGQKVGAVPIPTSTMLREYELVHIINNSEAVAVITTDQYVEAIEKIRPQCATLKHVIVIGEAKEGQVSYNELMKEDGANLPYVETLKDDPAYFLYTSGTTGAPKGVVHAHRFTIGAGDPVGMFAMGVQRGDICSGPTALTWMYALGHNFIFSRRWGISTAIYYDERFDKERAFEFIEKYKLTHFVGSPTIYKMLMSIEDAEKKYDMSTLKQCLSSGEPLLAETAREWKRRFGIDILDSMGQTEAHEFCTTRVDLKVKVGSMGKPLPGIDVAIVDDDGNRMPPDELGHLVINKNHPGLFVEYFKSPELMEEVTIAGKWHDTKDLAYMDEDGYFWYGSRSDDIMTCHGYRISPSDVETALQEHKVVFEAGVAGVKDPEMGDKVKAWVVLHEGYEGSPELAKELQDFVKKTIAPYKFPREIEFIGELPKNSAGKILRRELRRWEKEKLEGK